MIPTCLSKMFKITPPTPDEELAEAVRGAANAYNNAVKKACQAGLKVSASIQYEGGYGLQYISDKVFTGVNVKRITSKEL